MSQRQWIVIIGVWVMVFLFVGLPSSLEKALAILTGLAIIVLAYRIRFKETAPREAGFTDSLPAQAGVAGAPEPSAAATYQSAANPSSNDVAEPS